LAEVVASNTPQLAPGDLVFADTGWQDYAVLPGKTLTKLAPAEPLSHLISVYGVAGPDRLFRCWNAARPKAARRWWYSAAAGAVGAFGWPDRQRSRAPGWSGIAGGAAQG